MQDIKQDVTDVEFTEVQNEPAQPAAAIFNPVEHLVNALTQSGYAEPRAWTKHLDPRAETAENEKDRIFFANRALRLYLAEVPERENISPRMLLADGIDSAKWCALMEQGVIPWLMGAFNERGDRVQAAETEQAAGESTEETAERTGADEVSGDEVDARPSSSEV